MFRLTVVWMVVFSIFPVTSVHPSNIETELFITVSELKLILSNPDPDLLVIDVRDHSTYTLEHVPTAINLPTNLIFNESGDPNRIAPLHQVKKYFSQAGIKNTDNIILYDDGLLKDAAYTFWVMETYGHKNIRVLDGGFPAWVSAKGTVTGTLSKRPVSNYIPTITPEYLASKLVTRLAVENNNIAIVDARTKEDYLGHSSKAERHGHIKGAMNIPWTENLDLSGNEPHLKSDHELAKLYNKLANKSETIAYCNRGRESALTYLILRRLGHKVSIYDGAWFEWGNDYQLPINNPAQTGQKTVNDK